MIYRLKFTRKNAIGGNGIDTNGWNWEIKIRNYFISQLHNKEGEIWSRP
ncbi:hypothetical protein LINPERHAP1_LOCUS28913 [Linum perenne]